MARESDLDWNQWLDYCNRVALKKELKREEVILVNKAQGYKVKVWVPPPPIHTLYSSNLTLDQPNKLCNYHLVLHLGESAWGWECMFFFFVDLNSATSVFGETKWDKHISSFLLIAWWGNVFLFFYSLLFYLAIWFHFPIKTCLLISYIITP